MRGLVFDILREICDNFEEVTMKIRNPLRIVRNFRRNSGETNYSEIASHLCHLDEKRRPIRYDNGGTPDWLHQLFRVRLKTTGKSFAIDLSNAQHGRYDTVIPWHEYVEDRALRILKIDHMGTYDESKVGGVEENGVIHTSETNIRYLDLLQFYQARMRFEVAKWLPKNNLQYDSLLELNKSIFDEKSQHLADQVANALAGLHEATVKSGDFTMLRRTTNDPKEDDKLRMQHLEFLASHKVVYALAELDNWC